MLRSGGGYWYQLASSGPLISIAIALAPLAQPVAEKILNHSSGSFNDWTPLVVASVTFLGATLAQILNHLFTLRREDKIRDLKTRHYVEHIKFDIVLAVSQLEVIIASLNINSSDSEFVFTDRSTYKTPFIDLIERLDFNIDVNPQFMLNVRKFFSYYQQEMDKFSTAIKGTKVSKYGIVGIVALYLQGLQYIVATQRMQNRSWIERRWNAITPIEEVSYQDVLDAYKTIGFAVPDRRVFDSAKDFDSNVLNELRARRGLENAVRSA